MRRCFAATGKKPNLNLAVRRGETRFMQGGSAGGRWGTRMAVPAPRFRLRVMFRASSLCLRGGAKQDFQNGNKATQQASNCNADVLSTA